MARGLEHVSEQPTEKAQHAGRGDRQQDRNGDGPGREPARRNAKAYQFAMEAVFSIPIAGGLGWWADKSFGTGPFGLLVGLALGFAAFAMRLTRMRRLVEEASARAREEAEEP